MPLPWLDLASSPAVDDHGRIACTMILTAPPLQAGVLEEFYDIVIDADKDGFISLGDYYDGGKNEDGHNWDFRVVPVVP